MEVDTHWHAPRHTDTLTAAFMEVGLAAQRAARLLKQVLEEVGLRAREAVAGGLDLRRVFEQFDRDHSGDINKAAAPCRTA